MEFWGFIMLILLKFTFLSVAYWVFSSVFGSHLIRIHKIIHLTFLNSVNLWPVWWEYVCYEHQLKKFYFENCNHAKFRGFRYVKVYWKLASAHAIELSSLAIFICLFITPSKIFAKFNTCCTFGLSLIRLKSLY